MELITNIIQGAWNTNWIFGVAVVAALIGLAAGIISFVFNNVSMSAMTWIVVGAILIGGGYKVVNSDEAVKFGNEAVAAKAQYQETKNVISANTGENNEVMKLAPGAINEAFGK